MLWICLQCTTAYSVGAEGCPHCGSTEYAEDGTEEARMAKISRAAGPTLIGAAGPEVTNLPAGSAVVEVVLLPDDDITEYLADVPEADGQYGAMLRADLVAECVARGLPSSGTKAELVARLAAADEADSEQDSDPV